MASSEATRPDRQSIQGAAAGQPEYLPRPLGELIDKIDRAVADLADGPHQNEAMHALRSGLSDICALTEEDPRILKAVDRVVSAGDRLAATVSRPRRSTRSDPRSVRLSAAHKALAALDGTLLGARPSRIALSLNRGW